ncbi:potassium channel family protein [Pararhizobium sp. BT-229]|uniref:potassium channel family protein n=1 Tax=Pararhizobium sp. BT-229 TaxID=2986923 RepID=UPI0021F79D6A|nr:potassium channel family protein [Pararhizobium sp. BT-229]MCV9966011.1 potassium channel family protein [Pararhizobium sp. BT-229]
MAEQRQKPGEAPLSAVRDRLRALYLGTSRKAIQFQITMAIVDVAIIAFFLVGPYFGGGRTYLIIDYAIAAIIAFELGARALIASNLKRWLTRPMTWVDVAILATLLFPATFSNFAFLRAFRIWSLGQSKVFTLLIRRAGYAEWEDVVRACINFLTFLFLVTGFVYTAFFYHVAGIEGFVDALYFTVATITTTGFGDITLPGMLGKLTSIVTMIFGISLFVRLAQAIVRPHKVAFPCPECGLQRHDADAVHCKACGHLLNIPDEGS